MDAQDLKDKIKSDNYLKTILTSLGMKHIVDKGDYYSCCMPDGDNKSSTVAYKDSLYIDAYTRDIEDKNGNSDIISLVSFINKSYFSNSIKWICDICGYNYYGSNKEIPLSNKWMREILSLGSYDEKEEKEKDLVPVDESLLSYYKKYQNKMFQNDNISLNTQKEFEIGYDLETHRITIPIRDEIGTLVGVKGRLFKDVIKDGELKYIYLIKCAKSKILFGLNKTYPYIKRSGRVYIFESEKAVMQMWSYGIKNCVAVGNHKISKYQSNLITHLGVEAVFCYDQGIGIVKDEDDNIVYNNGKYILDSNFWEKQSKYFVNGQSIGTLYDKQRILEDKESPSDNIEKWNVLKENVKWISKK